MCAETAIKNNLSLAIGILIIAGVSLGWLGKDALEDMKEDTKSNTEFRIAAEIKDKHTAEEFVELSAAVKEGTAERRENHDLLIQINSKLDKWEPVKK